MFKKLLSNLPFNPSLINQVSFYARRVHQESSVRRSGLVLIVLAMFLQLFAVVAPPEASLLASGNDIIPGGFSSKATALEYCERNAYNFRNILHRFDADCGSLAGTTTKTIRSTDYNRQLLSLGRWQYNKAGERPVTGIYGEAETLYLRYLWAWDSGPYSSYKALVGTNVKGQPFMVLYDCGNIVVIENQPATPPPVTPAAAPKKPIVEITKKTTIPGTPRPSTNVRPGDQIGYRIFFQNRGDGTATNVFVEDSIPRLTTFVPGSQGSGRADRYAFINSVYPGHGKEKHVYWVWNTLPAGATGYYVDFSVKVDKDAKDGERICNTAFIRSNQTPQTESDDKICHTVKVNAPKPPVTEPSSPPPPTIVTVVKPCEKAADENDAAACLELHKTATNDTQNIIDANNTTAKPGDTITYSLTTRNYGTKTVSNYVIKENLADVMEYVDKITDFNGAKIDDKQIVSWPATTISAGETVTRKITVRLKKDIPDTPTPPGNPGSFDLMLTNVYGDAVNIKLPGSVAKAVAVANTTLPRTGPGETVAAAVIITMLAAYFFARSRLMAKELDLVREDYAASGGV